MKHLPAQDEQVFNAIKNERERQQTKIELIASENFVSEAVMEAQGSVLTNKYAEGYPGKRYYGGCEHVDVVEDIARDRAKEIFGAEHVNVQPHSGAQANMAVYFTILEQGDTVLGMNLSHGGHLTHGSPVNFSGVQYNFVEYGVDKETQYIDYDDVREKALAHKPKLASGHHYTMQQQLRTLSAQRKNDSDDYPSCEAGPACSAVWRWTPDPRLAVCGGSLPRDQADFRKRDRRRGV